MKSDIDMDLIRMTKLDSITKINILGVGVSTVNLQSAISQIEIWIKDQHETYITVTPAHALMDCYNHPELKPIFNRSGMTTPDGMAVVWILHLLGQREVGRVYGPDLMSAICERSLQTGWRHYIYGSTPNVIEDLRLKLGQRFPGINIAGTYSPPFRELSEAEDQDVVNNINAANPDIVWVGIGSPRQEVWMSQHLGRINAPVQIGVGAAFDFLSGHKKQAPRLIQRSGFEWLFRLLIEPKRLWKRYIQYPLFVLLVLEQLMGIRKYYVDIDNSNK
jgi:N-acetylglucosaminyldiphosphoundecaprenol N-acetyl-beta-D-mannosaminyltransferase